MPAAFVRKFPFGRNTGSNLTATATGLTFTTGDLVVLTVIWYNITIGSTIADVITFADTNGNIWHKVPGTFQQQTIGGGTGFDSIGIQLWYSNITVGGSGITATATFPTNVNYPGVYGAECSGVDSVDQATSAKSASGPANSGNITTGTADTFIYGSLYDDTAVSTGVGSGWTLLDNAFNTYYHGYSVPGSIVTKAADTNSVSNTRFVAAVVSFRTAPVGGAAKPPVVCIMQ
jgi:hypothetical protein